MNELIEKFISHLKFDDYLDDTQVEELISLFPQARYEGIAYRVIRSLKERDISKDKSFTTSKDGVIYMTQIRDMDDITVYQASIEGLDVVKLCEILKSKHSKKFPDFVTKELEVIAVRSPQNIEIIYQGKAGSFH